MMEAQLIHIQVVVRWKFPWAMLRRKEGWSQDSSLEWVGYI